MGKEFKTEELLENLPDYINGKIEDGELKNAISRELSDNPDFKNEFDSLNSAFKNISSFTFAEPPENYFNNLLPRINEKIHAESKIFNFKKSFSAIWKFALPVTAVILMFIGYKTFFNNNEYINNIAKNDSQVVLNNNTGKIENNDNNYKDNDAYGNVEPVESEDNNYTTNNSKSTFTRQTETERNNINNSEENNNIAIDLTENTSDDDVFFSNDDEPNIEQEFEKLNTEEQNKLLTEIKNSKF